MPSLSAPAYSIVSTSNVHYDAPAYSSEAALDERVLDHTPSFYRPVPTGTYSRADDHLSLTLKEQVDGVKIPSYGRHGLVKGNIVLNRPEGNVAINLKVRFYCAVDPRLECTNRYFP